MNSFELEMTLGEFGIDAQDKCKTCPRLGGLVTKLSTAQENKGFLTTSSDEEVLVASARTQLREKVLERYPDATEEKIVGIVEGSVASYLNSESYTNFLKQAGTLIEVEDNTIKNTLGEIQGLVEYCPPSGCGSV